MIGEIYNMENYEFENQSVYIGQHDEECKQAKKEMRNAGIFFLVLLLLEIPVSIVVGIFQGLLPDKLYYTTSILITQGYLLVGALLYMFITKKKFVRDLKVRKYKVSTFFLSLLVLIAASPMSAVLNLLSQLFVKNNTSLAILEVSEAMPMWLGIMVVGCLPGFIEETIYRGIMYQAFRKRSIWTGIIISALSFGLMHMNFNQIMYAVYLGLIFAFIAEATGSITSTMILHMIFNGVNTAYIYILPKILKILCELSSEYADMYLDQNGNVNMKGMLSQEADTVAILSSLRLYVPLAFFGMIATIFLLRCIAKINERDISIGTLFGNAEITSRVKPVNVCLIIGWIICIAFASLELIP